jgi:ATP-dependent RNA helicase DDX51/DBP6
MDDAPANRSTNIGASSLCQRLQLRKLLYSATLTKDPQKLAALKLVNPKYFDAHHLKRGFGSEGTLYRMPENLQECTVECTAQQKPIVLLALLLERLQQSAATSIKTEKELIVVFTSSLESTHRLTRLLQLLWQAAKYGNPPMEFSSALNQSQRSQLLQRCNDPHDDSVSVLICSDGMSRGMDLCSVRTVIHYDIPAMAKTYVHRCGRTARAGKHGQAVALLKGKGQVGQFSRLRRLISHPERVTKSPVKTSLVRRALPLYKDCVSRLKDVLGAEDRGELMPFDSDLSHWVPSPQVKRTDGDSSDDDDDSTSSRESSGSN